MHSAFSILAGIPHPCGVAGPQKRARYPFPLVVARDRNSGLATRFLTHLRVASFQFGRFDGAILTIAGLLSLEVDANCIAARCAAGLPKIELS